MTDTPLTDSHVKAWARALRLTEDVRQDIETALKSAGLPPLLWYDLLLELDRAGPNGLRPFQLQSEMLIRQYNLSRLLSRVVKAGYATREECDSDGRGQIVRITDAGRTVKDAMWPIYRAALEKSFAARLSEADAARLLRLLS
ncbi:MarR family winged helix-turn-helix transcriptional regulator [Ovoidimarina sediminis]|uniref:MarR family winged helix-turn-helix transcriptional regulator n=1 Tax=Ovoidimarina sediminis TaxID=3079856 RepID=UPI00290F2965|nr:MarR family winged helix-turn-helix transcriptional regulator [Rhodophyticola sp. MJ-SS7]MDU8943534.1 MarR family winged helix-turn-helix transcriptional regulator [Rhodophyticola sp. MJ-SS7]